MEHCASEPDAEQQQILKRISAGQNALRQLRIRLSGLLLTAVLLTGMIRMTLELRDPWYAADIRSPVPDCVHWFVEQFLWDVGFLLASLAPLADDAWVSRGVLICDMSLLITTRTRIWVQTRGLEVAPHQMLRLCFFYLRGALFVVLAAWAVFQPGAEQVQARMWDTLLAHFVSNIVGALGEIAYEVLCLRGSCFFGALGRIVANLLVLTVAGRQSWREGLQAWLRRKIEAKGTVAAAAGIAGLIGGYEPRLALREAKENFCGVRAEDLMPETLLNNCPAREQIGIAIRIKLGRCDAFISHSWQDDPAAKCQALQSWRLSFVSAQNREPIIWLDKVCIDQTNIARDLRCLPLFMMGCQSLVVLCGTTYLSRLWCILEIFTFVHAGGDLDRVVFVPVLRDGQEEEDMQTVHDAIGSFDAQHCQCTDSKDRERIRTLLLTGFGSMARFNRMVRGMLARLCEENADVEVDSDVSKEETGSDSFSAVPSYT